VCDRFIDSSLAYQGHAGGLGIEAVLALHEVGSKGLMPDATLLLELPRADASARERSRDGADLDRFGRKAGDYHGAVAAGFRRLAELFPERIRTIDASGTPEEVTARLLAALEPIA
jgi:dTMP kinase